MAPYPVAIQGRGMALHPQLQAYALARVRHALDHATDLVRGVDVRLSEAGGGHAGLTPRRRTVELTVRTLGRGVVRVEDEEADMHAAVDVAAHKLRRKMDRLKGRARARRDEGPDRALALPGDGGEVERDPAEEPGPAPDTATVLGQAAMPGADADEPPGIVRHAEGGREHVQRGLPMHCACTHGQGRQRALVAMGGVAPCQHRHGGMRALPARARPHLAGRRLSAGEPLGFKTKIVPVCPPQEQGRVHGGAAVADGSRRAHAAGCGKGGGKGGGLF